MRPLLLFTTLALCTAMTSAQNIEFGGYLNAKVQVIDFADTAFIGHTETFRLEAKREIESTASLEAHLLFSSAFEAIDPSANFKEGSFMEKANNDLMASLLEGVALPFDTAGGALLTDDPRITNLYYSSMISKDAVSLDRAVLKLFFTHADFSIGKQVISWGTGYAWNPTDFWNMKSPTDPEAAKLGVTALRTEIPIGDLSSIDLVVAPGLGFDEGSAGVRVTSNIAGFDYSLITARQMTPDRTVYGLPPKWITGFDLAGDIFDGIGIWFEGAYKNRIFSGQSIFETDSAYVDIDAGFNYTFDNGIMAMVEYYYNGLGKESASEYTSGDFMNMFSGEMTGLGQSYTLTSLSYDFLDFYKGSINSIMNVNDQSFTLLPILSYSWNSDVTLSVGANIFIGELESEFGSLKPTVYGEAKGYF
ncbi:MAG: hypothetical protein OCD01_11520 [Fibrobacterales bacterium]